MIVHLKKSKEILEAKVHQLQTDLEDIDNMMSGTSTTFSLDDNSLNPQETNYLRTCLACGYITGTPHQITQKPEIVYKVHILKSSQNRQYSRLHKPCYDDNFEAHSGRNLIPLCGSHGVDGTCHSNYDNGLLTLLWHPFNSKFVFYTRDSSGNYTEARSISSRMFPEAFTPYRRALMCKARYDAFKPGANPELLNFVMIGEKAQNPDKNGSTGRKNKRVRSTEEVESEKKARATSSSTSTRH